MTFDVTKWWMHWPLTGQCRGDKLDHGHAYVTLPSVNSISTDGPAQGGWHMRFNGATKNTGLVCVGAPQGEEYGSKDFTDRIVILFFKVRLGSGTQNRNMPLLSQGWAHANLAQYVHLKVVDDVARVAVEDKNGNEVLVATVDVPTGSNDDYVVVIDSLTLSTVWVSIMVGGVHRGSVDTGLAPSDFWATSGISSNWIQYGGVVTGGSDFGRTFYIDNMMLMHTPNADEAPHLSGKNVPQFEFLGAADRLMGNSTSKTASPFGEYDESPWSGVLTNVNAIPTDDTPFWQLSSAGTDKRRTAHWQGVGNLIGTRTPYQLWHINRSRVQPDIGDKESLFAMWRFNGAEIVTTQVIAPGTTFAVNPVSMGNAIGKEKPGGGLWDNADMALDGDGDSLIEVGVKSQNSGSPRPQITEMYAPMIACASANKNLTETPVAVVGGLHERKYPHGALRGVLRGVA